jgi:hypothetical protein
MPNLYNASKKALLITLLIAVLATTQLAVQSNGLQITDSSEYQTYVHTYINSSTMGNATYVEKPIFPVYFNTSQIEIGENWTIICPLVSNHTYHVYCYGAWVNTTSAAKTDYDIYVYDPQGLLESEHTEAAGFPEHLGTNVDDPLFAPAQTGNYTFVIANDARESKGAQQATFMIVEDLECNVWQTHYAEGKDGSNAASLRTCWTYEFVTESPTVEVWINVPDTMDMYEARLYLMNNPESLSINGFPLPWEPGLYGNISDSVGGYNLEFDGYRGVAYASCEFKGQAMFLNYTSTQSGKNLYQLVFIGEVGSGDLNFLIKTQFGEASLIPQTFPIRITPNTPVDIAYNSTEADIENATLQYSTDNWETSTAMEMMATNRTCNATIPGQNAGTLVQYQVQAHDTLKNDMSAAGNYTVKQLSTLNITAVHDTVTIGDNITVTGLITPENESLPVDVQFFGANTTEQVECETYDNGTFTASFKPDATGLWAVQATSAETDTVYQCESVELLVHVEDPPFYVTYGLFIIGGAVGGSVAGAVVYLKKFRNR